MQHTKVLIVKLLMTDIVRFNSKTTIDGEVFDTWNRDNQATRIGTENYGVKTLTRLYWVCNQKGR